MMKKLLINIIAAAAMLVPLSLSAQDTRVQESRKAKLEKEIALIDKQLKENAAKSSNALTTLNLVRKKVADRKELVAESDREIATLTGRINAKQKDVDRVQARLDTLSLYYSKLVKSAYKNRDSKVWYMYILASENVGQAFRRAGYLRNLSAEMNRQGEKIIDTKSELQREMDSLSVLKRDAEVIRSRRAADVQSLQQEEAESAKIVTQLQRNRTKYQKELAAKKRQVDALNREIQRIIAAAVNGKSGKSTARKPVDIKLDAEFAKNKGKLPWPADGAVVDHFGQHYHPVFKSVKLPFNNGITISMAKGAAVQAVFDGVVKQIVVMPGYNKCVLVQHGNYFSFYCKLGSAVVKPGDKIKTGDIIGTVDTIDGATQLHFQIWKGTTPQDPEKWLR